MTLREFMEGLEIPRPVALRLVQKVAGAKKEPAGAGKIARWWLPDNAVELVDEDMLAEARQEAARAPRAPEDDAAPAEAAGPRRTAPPDPALREASLDVERERLEAERIRAETAKLQAESQRRKAQRELDMLSEPRPATDPTIGATLDRLERSITALAARPAPDATGTLAELLKLAAPILGPLVERLTTAPPVAPAAPVLGLSELLGQVAKLREVFSAPETRAVSQAFREGVAIGRERATAETGGDGWLDLARTALPVVDGVVKALVPRYAPAPAPAATTAALPAGAPAPTTEGAPAAATDALARWQGILDELVRELRELARRAPEDRDVAPIAAFLEAVRVDGETTLRDQVLPVALSQESAARVVLDNFDARLVDAETWEGTRALLAHLRAEAQREVVDEGR